MTDVEHDDKYETPTTYGVWVTQQWMSATCECVYLPLLQGESCRFGSLWLHRRYQPTPSSTATLPSSGWERGRKAPAKSSLSYFPHLSQALGENKDKIQLKDQNSQTPPAAYRSQLLSKALTIVSGNLDKRGEAQPTVDIQV